MTPQAQSGKGSSIYAVAQEQEGPFEPLFVEGGATQALTPTVSVPLHHPALDDKHHTKPHPLSGLSPDEKAPEKAPASIHHL